ncbi:hypothetical protein DS838_001445 [Geotrichum bryndzae]|nr:hypothetical protein DS838_001445 [Geotrichum bryndzae]
MICIECMSPVQTLYTSYSLSNIRLTACPQCNKFADKYIEYDNVLIFIDLLLLRPQVYRHMVYNTLAASEDPSSKNSDPDITTTSDSSSSSSSNPARPVFALHRKTVRFFILITLFDVYLTWAKAERETMHEATAAETVAAAAAAAAAPTAAAFFFKRLPVLGQYINFMLFCLVDTLLFYFLIYCLAVLANRVLPSMGPAAPVAPAPAAVPAGSDAASRSSPLTPASELSSLPSDPSSPSPPIASAPAAAPAPQALTPKPVAAAPLITALIISSSAKLFPILMVIWSYDVPVAATILAWAVSFNTVEALRIVLNRGYAEALAITAVAETVRFGVIRPALMAALQHFWQFIGF